MSPTSPANRHQPPLDFEPIDELIRRLGRPPPEIVDQWCKQLRASAIVDTSALIPPSDLSKWLIGPNGELVFESQTYAGHPEAKSDVLVSEANQVRIDAFRIAVLKPETNQPDAAAADLATAAVNQAVINETAISQVQRKVAIVGTKKRSVSKAKWAAVVVLIVLLVVGLGRWASGPPAEPTNSVAVAAANSRQDSQSTNQAFDNPTKNASRIDHAVDNSRSAHESTEPGEMKLETFASASPDSPSDDEIPVGPPGLLEMPFPNDSFLSSADNFALDPSAPQPDDSQQQASQSPPQTPAPEIPQPVRLANAQAITLPKLSGDEPSITIEGLANDNLVLEFPYPIGLQLQQQEPNDSYLIRENKGGRIIASLSSDEFGSLRFAWDDEGKKSANAGLLQHGRLKDAKGQLTYLRPRIEADRWAMSFTESDYQPSWDLGGTIPPVVSRLAVEFDLSEEFEVGWVEPVDAESLRRTEAVAVLSHKEFEFVQIAVWLNMRCSRKFVCGVRFAARIDPSLPWQSFTAAGLAEYSSRLLQRSDQLDQQQTRLDALYARADSRSRKTLQDNRENLKTQIEWTTEMSARVSQLQAMVTSLSIHGKIRFEILARWPDGEQFLLSMPQPLAR